MVSEMFDEFEEWLARVFNLAVWSQQEQLGQAASLLDQDGDGDLDDDDIDELFDECDVDRSGTIELDELVAHFLARGRDHGSIMREWQRALTATQKCAAPVDRRKSVARLDVATRDAATTTGG